MLLLLLRLSRDFVIRQTAGRLKITFVCLRLICSLEHLFLVHYTVFKEHPVPELPSSHRAAFPLTRSRCSLPFAPLGSHLGFARLSLSSDSFAIIPPPQAFVNTFFHFSFRPFLRRIAFRVVHTLPKCYNSLSTFITPFCPLFAHYIKKYIRKFRFFLQIRHSRQLSKGAFLSPRILRCNEVFYTFGRLTPLVAVCYSVLRTRKKHSFRNFG